VFVALADNYDCDRSKKQINYNKTTTVTFFVRRERQFIDQLLAILLTLFVTLIIGLIPLFYALIDRKLKYKNSFEVGGALLMFLNFIIEHCGQIL